MVSTCSIPSSVYTYEKKKKKIWKTLILIFLKNLLYLLNDPRTFIYIIFKKIWEANRIWVHRPISSNTVNNFGKIKMASKHMSKISLLMKWDSAWIGL